MTDLARVGEVGVWCDCGDGIMPNSGAKCGNCIAAESAPREWVGIEPQEIGQIWAKHKEVYGFGIELEQVLKERNT